MAPHCFTPLILTYLWAKLDPSRTGAEVRYYVRTVFFATAPAAMLPREQETAYALPLPFFPHEADDYVCVNSKFIALCSGRG